jgi:hypothetical protein
MQDVGGGRSGSTGDRQRATIACEQRLSRNRAARLLQGWRRDVCPVQAKKTPLKSPWARPGRLRGRLRGRGLAKVIVQGRKYSEHSLSLPAARYEGGFVVRDNVSRRAPLTGNRPLTGSWFAEVR